MTRSLAAMTDSVYTQMEGGWVTDDSRLPRDLVRDKVLKISWEAIGKHFASRIGRLPSVLYQQCCIDVSCENICDSPATRLVGTLPGIMGMLGDRSLRYVGTVEGRSFSPTTTRIPYENYQPFAGKPTPSYRITGNSIEVINAPMGLGRIMIEGIFADPTVCDLCLTDEQYIIPLPPELLDGVEVQALKELTQWWKQFARVDKRNDSVPNT